MGTASTGHRPDADSRGAGRLQAAGRRLRTGLRRPRLKLALKAALAAGLAWQLALAVPGAAQEYPYYAPVGALLSMYHTVAGSVKTAAQTLAGLLLGIGLAWLLMFWAAPSALSVGLLVCLGVLVAGIPRLGSGRDWVPVAALFVLLVGGSDAGDYATAYLVQTAVGAAVGITINVLVFPPLHFHAAATRLAELRQDAAGQLEQMAEALVEPWPPDHRDWVEHSEDLAQLSARVRQAVQEAAQSSKGNPRRRLHPRDLDEDYRRLRQLERTVFHVRDMADVLSAVIWEERLRIPPNLVEPLADTMAAVAAAIRGLDDDDGQLLEEASGRHEELMQELDRLAAGGHPSAATGSLSVSLGRILTCLQPASAGRERE